MRCGIWDEVVFETYASCAFKAWDMSVRLNIVLDRIYNAKICDFGLTQLGS